MAARRFHTSTAKISSTLLPVAAPKLSAASSVPSPRSARTRDACANVDEDQVMVEIKKRRPVSAWACCHALRDSPAASLLRARALVALGSLASADRAYRTAIAKTSSPGSPSAVEEVAAHPLAQLAKAELTQLFALSQTLDGVGAALNFFFPRKVAMESAAPDVSNASGSSHLGNSLPPRN